MRTPDPLPEEAPLCGWVEIAQYLGKSVATVRRWGERSQFPLPYHVTLGHPWASRFELQVWLRQNTISGQLMAEVKRSEMSKDEHTKTD
jgi:hypothetical protein